jgi:hypothetical protein
MFCYINNIITATISSTNNLLKALAAYVTTTMSP